MAHGRESDSGDVMFVVILLLLVVFDSVFSNGDVLSRSVWICFGLAEVEVQPDRKPIGFYFLRVRKLKGRVRGVLLERRRSGAVIVHFSVDLLSLCSTIHDIAEFTQEMMTVVLVQLAARLFPYYSGFLRCHNITISIC